MSLLIFAPLGGSEIGEVIRWLPAAAWNMLLLQPVNAPQVFAGSPYPYLNASLWTISYEFRCYLLVIVLSWSTMLRRPMLLAWLTVAGFAVFLLEPFGPWSTENAAFPLSKVFIGRVGDTIRLTSLFLAGSLFYILRDRISFNMAGAMAAAAGLIIGLHFPALAEPSVAIFGGYLIFAFSSAASGTPVSRIRNDISYGIYLYGWPIGALIIWLLPSMSLSVAIGATLLLAIAFGWASWLLVERPAMRRMTKRVEHVDVTINEADIAPRPAPTS